MVGNIAYRQTTFNGAFHIINGSLSKNSFLSVDIIFYFCLTCTQTEQFQKAATSPTSGTLADVSDQTITLASIRLDKRNVIVLKYP
jgi:hypothetical protein